MLEEIWDKTCLVRTPGWMIVWGKLKLWLVKKVEPEIKLQNNHLWFLICSVCKTYKWKNPLVAMVMEPEYDPRHLKLSSSVNKLINYQNTKFTQSYIHWWLTTCNSEWLYDLTTFSSSQTIKHNLYLLVLIKNLLSRFKPNYKSFNYFNSIFHLTLWPTFLFGHKMALELYH